MSSPRSQYQAYSLATRTVAKTRQIVMLYDGAIRFLRQANAAITEKRVEDRFHLLKRTSEVLTGLQSCIDFENGGEVANVLHRFYTGMSVRALSINFKKDPEEGRRLCEEIIEELKQMRDVWDSIDHSLSAPAAAPEPLPATPVGSAAAIAAGQGSVVTLSA